MTQSSPSRRLRVAIIGTGGIANSHARGYLANAAAEVVAVCDVEAERAQAFAEKYGFGTPYSDPAVLLREEKPDAVSICTPNFLHAPLTILALEAGASVLCEKPMATNLADAERMKDAAQRSGKALYIGFNHRFIGKFRLGKDLLDSGDYGKLLAARIAIGHGDYARLSGMWFADRSKSGGGTFIDNGVHMLDMLRWYGGSITSVSAQAHRLLMERGDVEDNAIAVFRLGNGGIASLQCSWTWPPRYTLLFHMICERGTIDLSGDDVIAFRKGDGEPRTLTPPTIDTAGEQARHFLAAARGETAPFVSADDGIAAVRVALGAYESSDTGRTVALA
jgi:predicted dehydrogenase